MDKKLNNPTATGYHGRQFAKALFEEGGEHYKYSLEEFHSAFIRCEDLTEYEPAIELVETWVEWERLKRDWPTFNLHVQRWKEELEVIFRSRSIKQVLNSAAEGNFQASKWIAEHGFDKRQGAGRPSKKEKNAEVKAIAKAASETEEEGKRVLKLLKTGSENGD